MHWISKVLLQAGALALAVMALLNYTFGIVWLALISGLLTFVAAAVLVSFFVSVRDQRMATEQRRSRPRRGRSLRRRLLRPAPAIAIAARASPAEPVGRTIR